MNEKLNFHDLVGLLSEKAGITKKEAENFLREFFDLTTNALLEDKQVKIKNLGTFKIVDVNDRESVDVRTGERVVIPAHSKVSFAPDAALSGVVNEPFAMFEPVEIGEDSEIEQREENVLKDIKDLNDFKETEPESHTTVSEEPNDIIKPSPVKRKKKSRKSLINWILIAITALIIAAFFYIMRGDEDSYQSNYNDTIEQEQPKNEVLNQNDTIEITNDSINEIIVETVSEDTIKETEVENVVIVDPVKAEVPKVKPYTIVDGVKRRKIAEGERLTVIALQEYGSKDFWVYLYEENKAVIKNPENVMAGMEIIIPLASKYSIDKDDSLSIKRARELQKRLK